MYRNRIKWLLVIIVISLVLCLLPNAPAVSAEGVGALLGSNSSSADIGSTITITVQASVAIPATNYRVSVGFDPSLVSYTGYSDSTGAARGEAVAGAATVTATAFGGTSTTANLCQFTFKANAAGSAVFTISYVEMMDDPLIVPPAGAATTVTIRTPLPGNTNLKSLRVDQGTLSPAFSAGQQSYTLPVAMGVGSIVVQAEPEDPQAKVSVSGNSGLSDGANTIRVVVTAQNGSTKTYTITANRQGPTPTPEPTPTPPVSLTVNGTRFSVTEPPEGMEVPAGFYASTIDINGQPVTAFKSIRGELILLYLSNDGPESGFYFYDAETGELHDYAVIRVPGAVYTRLKPGPEIEIPAGFTQASLTIDGEMFECWRPLPEFDSSRIDGGSGDIYLLYLMDERGERGFFLYQVSSRQIFPLSMIPREPEPTPLPSPSPSPTPTPVPEPVLESSPMEDPYVIATIALAALSVVLLGLLVWSLLRNGGAGRNGPDGGGSGLGGPGGKEDDRSGDLSDRHKDALPRPPKIRRVE